MPSITSTVHVSDLARIIEDPTRGTISLRGDSGGISLITGNIQPSGLIKGTVSIETEHGTIYLDADLEVQISEDTASTLTTDDLYAVNDRLTALLQDRFNWSADSDAADEALNNLTHDVASHLDNFLAATTEVDTDQ